MHLVTGDEEASSSQFFGYVLVEEGDDVFVSSIFHLVNKFYDVGRAVGRENVSVVEEVGNANWSLTLWVRADECLGRYLLTSRLPENWSDCSIGSHSQEYFDLEVCVSLVICQVPKAPVGHDSCVVVVERSEH